MPRKRRIWGLIVGIVGLVLFIASFVWTSVAVPRLVMYPDDVDETPRYAGEVTLYVDPQTAAPLEAPQKFPLTVDRHIQAVESSSDLVVVKETATLKATGLFEGTQEQQYVMDRRDMENVADPRAWAFDPSNVVDRSPSYRINLPFDNDQQPYPIYANEVETSYDATPDPAQPTGTVEGLSVNNFVADFPYQPASEAYLASLDRLLPQPLPRELGLTELTPLLASKGIDLQALLPALLPALSEADREAVLALAQQPVKLAYAFRAGGDEATDRSTGAIVQVRRLEQHVAASPDPALVPQLEALLSKYTQVPGVTDAVENLKKLADEPILLFTNTFSQTEESVAEIADSVRELSDKKNLAENTIPAVLRWVGVALAVIGFAVFLLWRKSPRSPAAAVETSAPAPDASMDAPTVIAEPPPADAADPPPGGTAP